MPRYSMPFLIVNYGAEMIFILEQRLQAQNVKHEKSAKVLGDVTKSMFAPQFVQELMRPQEMYSAAATREIFDHLAQSSIMRLSENSMDKLFDLMTMGCKYQCVSCRHPLELVELTLTHLDAVKEAVRGTPSEQLLQNTTDLMIKQCQALGVGQLMDIRHQILNFYQDKRIKVSLFLGDGIQSPDGFFSLQRGGEVAREPPVQLPGRIHYFEAGECVAEERFNHPDCGRVREAGRPLNIYDPAQRTTPLGKNLYLAERKKPEGQSTSKTAAASPKAPPPPSPDASSPKAHSGGSGSSSGLAKRTSFRQRSGLGGSFSASTSERASSRSLNSLSALITAQAPKDAFKIALFDERPEEGATAAAAAPVIEIARVSREDVTRANAELMGIYTGLDGGRAAAANSSDAGQDLLDLMDG